MSYVNHGVIPGPKPGDWVRGKIPWQNRNLEGDWRGPKYMVVGEKQTKPFETFGCVSFATNNSKEMQLKPQLGYELNYNDQYLSVMSGTTKEGNRVSTVLDTDRKGGCVLESDWITNPKNWEEWNTQPSQELINLAPSRSIKIYDMQYEYIPDITADVIAHELHHAPLLTTEPGHEIVTVAMASSTEVWVLDTYLFQMDPSNPFLRKIKIKDITDLFKAVWTVKEIPLQLVNDNGTYFLEGEKGKIGIADLGFLNMLKTITDQEVKRASVGEQKKVVETLSNSFIVKEN